MTGRFDGRMALVTGITGSVGTALCRRLADEGSRIVMVGRRPGSVDALAGSLNADVRVEYADLADEGQVEALFERLEADEVRVDAVMHAAGGFLMGRAVHEPGLDQLDAMWRRNTLPVYLVCGRAARHMLERGIEGHIVAVTAKATERGGAMTSAYSASKAAALRIVESLALEVRGAGIHVNAVSPGTIDTADNRAAMPAADTSRWVTPEHVADAMLFLCTPAAGGIYGANIPVHGPS